MNKSEMIKKTETIENQAKELLAQVNALNTEEGTRGKGGAARKGKGRTPS